MEGVKLIEGLKLGGSDEWYTPEWIFEALNTRFDLDPCCPTRDHWTPAERKLTKEDDGLVRLWHGKVWMNPPFGGRNGIVPWLDKFVAHANGIGVAPARTSCGWFHEFMPKMDCLLFPKGKTKFIPGPGLKQSNPTGGIVMYAIGEENVKTLMESGLGLCLPHNPTA